jgi:Flp pilus assembly CpaE family ATPase
VITILRPRISDTTALATPNRPGPIATPISAGTVSKSIRGLNLFKISVICPDEQVVEDLDHILRDRDDVAIHHAFTRNPRQIELDRHLQFHSPQALLVASNADAYTLDLVAYLRRAYPHLPVVVLHTEANSGPASLLPFMRAGVREVIFQPFDRQEVREVVDRLRAKPAENAVPKAGKVLCFLPSKPGVGASTVAVNTAAALAQEGSRVLLVDGDLTSGMVRFMLKLKNPSSIRDAARRVSEMDEFLWPQLITEVSEGLDVLHAGKASLIGGLDSEILLSLLDFWRAAYDVICFDFSGNLEEFSLEAMRYADRIFVVSTSEVASLHLLMEKLQNLKASGLIDRVRVVQNRKAAKDDLTKRHIEQVIGMPICAVFRNSYSETLAASREGRTVRANSALGEEFKAFASELCGKPMRSRKAFSWIWAAFAKKTQAPQPLQLASADRSGTRALVEFQPVLALQEAAPKALVQYRNSARAGRM